MAVEEGRDSPPEGSGLFPARYHSATKVDKCVSAAAGERGRGRSFLKSEDQTFMSRPTCGCRRLRMSYACVIKTYRRTSVCSCRRKHRRRCSHRLWTINNHAFIIVVAEMERHACTPSVKMLMDSFVNVQRRSLLANRGITEIGDA